MWKILRLLLISQIALQVLAGCSTRNKKYVTPTEDFAIKFREIFTNTQIKRTTGKEARAWPAGPNMKHWLEQLNFAQWHETMGCGISWDILLDREVQVSLQLRAFLSYFEKKIAHMSVI